MRAGGPASTEAPSRDVSIVLAELDLDEGLSSLRWGLHVLRTRDNRSPPQPRRTGPGRFSRRRGYASGQLKGPDEPAS